MDTSGRESILRNLASDATFLAEFGQKATSYGLQIVPSLSSPLHPRTVACSLVPCVFRRSLLDKAVDVSRLFNLLVARISNDVDWLIVAHEVYSGPGGKSPSEDIQLYLNRNDFLPTENDTRILQVEINTISASFAGLIEKLSMVHKSNKLVHYPHMLGNFPCNKPCHNFASAMSRAVHLHNSKWNTKSKIVLFVVDENERNIVDQYMIEQALFDEDIMVIRRTFQQLVGKVSISSSGQLYVDFLEVSLVYYRTGYDPLQYAPNEQACWELRSTIEKSHAIKCPTVLAQLAGTKKVQQLWYTQKNIVFSMFGFTEADKEAFLSVFARQCDPSLRDAMYEEAIKNPENWVLKPQREGGGHNLYNSELSHALTTLTDKELAQFVLMERMNPNPQHSLVLQTAASAKEGCVVPLIIPDAVSELGIYSYYIPSIDDNVISGFLVRTKAKTVTEGGVNAGFAALDTLCLV